MIDIRINNLVLSIAAAIILIFCLGIAIFTLIIISRGADAVRSSEANGATGCQFTSQFDPLIIYHAPVGAPSQQKSPVPGTVAYPIIKQNRGYYLVRINDDLSGWANSREGIVSGSCDDVPIDGTALSEFDTVCAFHVTQEGLLYGDAELATYTGALAPGTYLVEVINGDRYYLILDANLQGWTLAVQGELSGACDALRTGT